MYPPLYCVKPVSLESVWFHYLVEDVACLHTIVFLSSIANDRIRGLPNSIISQTHLSKTLSLLSDRLSIGNRAVTDQTIVIVVLLAIAAIIFGDARAARTHVEGFRKMIEVRGGVNKLLPNRDLRYKACR